LTQEKENNMPEESKIQFSVCLEAEEMRHLTEVQKNFQNQHGFRISRNKFIKKLLFEHPAFGSGTADTPRTPMLQCPNDPEHKEFVMTAMVPETWFLNEDGDCEDIAEEGSGDVETDLTSARCQACSALVEITA
jgi:hypothetical protein